MIISTKKSIDWSALRADLTTFWEKMVPRGSYITPKIPFSNKKGFTCRMFASELGKGDVYCEFIDSDGSFHYPDRRLYKLAANVNFAKNYSLIPGKTDEYEVELSNFVIVENLPSKVKTAEKKVVPGSPTLSSISVLSEDYPLLLELNALDLYALMHNKPVSDNPIINNIILRNK